MAVTFTLGSATPINLDPVPGTLTVGDGNDDRGGQAVQNVRAGIARNGSFQVVVDTVNQLTLDLLISLPGEGGYTVNGASMPSSQYSYDAIVDVNLGEGEDGVEVATISWKGTIAPA